MTHPRSLAHFASIPLDPSSGMGRVAFHWRDALVRRDWNFKHYGTNEVPIPLLKPLWADFARRAWRNSGAIEDILLAHEPSAEALRRTGLSTVLYSHGLEARLNELAPTESDKAVVELKSYITRPFWKRLSRNREFALRKCPLLLLINEDDRDYAISHYGRRPEEIFVFRNGVNISNLQPNRVSSSHPTILFYGTWIERKGKTVLIKAAKKLAKAGIKPRWLLIGTGKADSEVLSDWPLELRSNVEVRSKVAPEDDDLIYQKATLFVLPSFYEGQPLTLLQAMESGRCVITTRCCGQKDIISNGHNGFLFEPGNSDELAQLIADALANDDMRMKIGRQAKKDMATRRWPDVADEVVDRLEEFFKNRKS